MMGDPMEAARTAYENVTGEVVSELALRKALDAYLSATPAPDGMEVVAWANERPSDKVFVGLSEDKPDTWIGNPVALVRADQAQSALAAMRVKDAQRLDHIKKLERRIHNQRRSNRDTWEIVESRNKWMGSPEARKAFARLLVRHRATEAQVQRLTEDNEALRDLAERLKLEAQGHASEARTANSTIYEIYQVLSGGKGEPGNWHGAEPARQYVAKAEAQVAALRDALEKAKALLVSPGNIAFNMKQTAIYTSDRENYRRLSVGIDRARAILTQENADGQ